MAGIFTDPAGKVLPVAFRPADGGLAPPQEAPARQVLLRKAKHFLENTLTDPAIRNDAPEAVRLFLATGRIRRREMKERSMTTSG